MSTGDKIRQIRKQNNLSQYALANKTKGYLNQSQIAKIEKGNRKITDIDLKVLAKALNISIEKLIQA